MWVPLQTRCSAESTKGESGCRGRPGMHLQRGPDPGHLQGQRIGVWVGAALKAPEPVQRLPMKPSGDSLQGLGPPGTPGAEAPLGGEHTFSPHQVWGRSRPPPPSPLIRPVANPDLSQDRGGYTAAVNPLSSITATLRVTATKLEATPHDKWPDPGSTVGMSPPSQGPHALPKQPILQSEPCGPDESPLGTAHTCLLRRARGA